MICLFVAELVETPYFVMVMLVDFQAVPLPHVVDARSMFDLFSKKIMAAIEHMVSDLDQIGSDTEQQYTMCTKIIEN